MRDLVRWNPFQELSTWHRDIDDLFDRFFHAPSREEGGLTSWWPAMEAFEKEGHYVVRLDPPGIDPKELDILAEDNTLIIKGERRKTEDVEDKGYHYRETSYGRFERSLELPKGVDTEKIAARYDKGVLEVSMPLPAHLVAKKVPIQIEGGATKASKAA